MPDFGRVLSALTVASGRRRDAAHGAAGVDGAGSQAGTAGRRAAGAALAPGPVAGPGQVVLPARPGGRAFARVLALLPPGTVGVGAGLAVLGAGSYAHLAVAGHSLPVAAMAQMSVLWSVVYLLGLGVFFPVEQELTRLVAARAAAGQGAAPVVRRGAAAAAALLGVVLLILVLAAGPLAGRLFDGDTALIPVAGSAALALAVTSVSRGTLAGLGRFDVYGRQLAADGGLRVLLACGLGAAGVRSAAAFGLILTVAPLVAVAGTARPLLAGLHPGPELPWRAVRGRLALLLATMLLAQVVISAAVLNIRVLSPGRPAVVGALLAAVVLARIPLFVFTPVQTALLPGLCGALAVGDRARFRLLLGRACAAVLVLGVTGGLLLTLAGPWLIRVLFGAHAPLPRSVFGGLAAGVLAYLLALVLGQGAQAQSRHAGQVLAWLAGAVVLAAVTLGPGTALTRVTVAFAAGSVTVVLVLAAVLAAGATGLALRGPRHGNRKPHQ
jgi:O-antigen/teichoic acid export membrane protein